MYKKEFLAGYVVQYSIFLYSLLCFVQLTSKIEYIHKHVANVRDVERLTGLRFFTALPAPVQARIKTKIVKQI